MKRNRILCVTLIGLLLMMAAGCQKTPGVLPGDSSVIASLQENISPAVSLDTSSESEMSASVAAPASSQTSHLQTSSVTENENSLQDSPSASPSSSGYIYSDKVANQMKEIDQNNPPETITVQFTAEASDPNKIYSEADFPGCDITIIGQGQYGGNSYIYPGETSNPNDPVFVYVQLKVNQKGFKNYEKTVQYLDQREDIAVIGLIFFEIPD